MVKRFRFSVFGLDWRAVQGAVSAQGFEGVEQECRQRSAQTKPQTLNHVGLNVP